MGSSFENYFVLKSLVITAAAFLFLLWKRILGRHVSHTIRYRMDILFLVLLTVPFLPVQNLLSSPVVQNLASGSGSSSPAVLSDAALPLARVGNWMNSFSVSSDAIRLESVSRIFLFLWIAGLVFCLFLLIRSFCKYLLMLHHAETVTDGELADIFQACLCELGIKRRIRLYETDELSSPAFGGLFHPRVFVPSDLLQNFSASELRFILLHELTHYRHKDAWISVLTNLIKVLYWYHPVVLYTLKDISADRELSCDSAVLHHISGEEYHAYGLALIRFAGQISMPFQQSSGIGGSKKQIYRRIRNIASGMPGPRRKLPGILALLLTACFFISCIPLLSAQASSNLYEGFTADNAVYHESTSFYEESFDSLVLYDEKSDAWEIYGGNDAFERVSPDSTYKIYSAVFALDAGLITPEYSLLDWDGTNYPFASWNQNQDLGMALENSVNWYFQSLDKELGLDRLSDYFEHIQYGNEDLSGGMHSYWMESSLKISPVEQVKLLHSLRKNEFQFSQKSLDALNDALYLETDSEGAKLYGKTGTGTRNGTNVNGWFVGYVVTDTSTCYFALNKKDSPDADGSMAARTALSILNEKQIFLSDR